jgi:hypothetical protein
MSDSGRLSQLLLEIIDRLKLGAQSPKAMWMNFSNGGPVSKDAFERVVTGFGLRL